jgi:hypothetical protein
MSALDGETHGLAHFQAHSANWSGFLAVMCLDDIFGFAVLSGAGHFTDSAAHTVFLFRYYSFQHNFSPSFI